jgi:hypothetical protein
MSSFVIKGKKRQKIFFLETNVVGKKKKKTREEKKKKKKKKKGEHVNIPTYESRHFLILTRCSARILFVRR